MTDGPPTVLHTVHALPERAGGPARTVPALCEAVALTGRYRVVLLTTSRPGETNLRPDPARVETVELPDGRPLRRRFREEIARLHADRRLAAIHDHGQWLATNRAAADAARRLGVPRVVAPRGMLSPWARSHRKLLKTAAWRAFARRDLNAAAAVHATSDLEAEELRVLGVRPPIQVIPNGVHVPDPLPDVPKAGVDDDDPREALFLSRIHPKKGLPDLIAAWAALTAEGVADGWRLRVVGPDELGHRADLERQATAAGLPLAGPGGGVRFEGPVADAEKWSLYARASLFVLPTHSENFGVVVAEALACGVPVVTTTAAPWALMREARCGWWVDPGAAPLAAALRAACVRSPHELGEMGGRGRETVRSRFGWGAIGTEAAALYKTLRPTSTTAPQTSR